MRRAEKTGDPRNPNLSTDGQARAERLVEYIPATFGKPSFVFATAISKHSARPIQTIKPLSTQLGLSIDATFADQDYGALAYELLSSSRFAGVLALVCWHHGNIPSLVRGLGGESGRYPDPWDPDVFNLILELTYASAEVPVVRSIIEPF